MRFADRTSPTSRPRERSADPDGGTDSGGSGGSRTIRTHGAPAGPAGAGGVQVLAVVDPDPTACEAARRLAPEAAVYADVDALLRGGEISCAVVASPHSTHAPILTRLLKADLDIYTEKPLALDLREAERIVDLAVKRGRILMVGFNRRHAPVCVAVKTAFTDAPVEFASALKARAALLPWSLLFEGIRLLDLLRWLLWRVSLCRYRCGTDA